jgi:hypothetical protein
VEADLSAAIPLLAETGPLTAVQLHVLPSTASAAGSKPSPCGAHLLTGWCSDAEPDTVHGCVVVLLQQAEANLSAAIPLLAETGAAVLPSTANTAST